MKEDIGKQIKEFSQMMSKEEPENKELLDSALIVKVSNGFLVYENDGEHRNQNNGFANQRKVFETKESLFEFLNHNL